MDGWKEFKYLFGVFGVFFVLDRYNDMMIMNVPI